MPGRLVLVGTPLGNLGDMTPRAIDALKNADLILCEDTRHSGKLLSHFGIGTRTERYDDHTEAEKAPGLIERIEQGAVIALVSDAGMPVLSDPGFRIVHLARERGIAVEPIPGPFAAAIALAASGIAPIPFTFLGFAPHREQERLDFYRSAAALGQTVVLYESPLRIAASLRDAVEAYGDAPAAVARELTKLHEEIARGTLRELLADFSGREAIHGEITIVIGARTEEPKTVSVETVRIEFERLRATGMRRNDVVKAIAETFGLRKNDVYRMLMRDPETSDHE